MRNYRKRIQAYADAHRIRLFFDDARCMRSEANRVKNTIFLGVMDDSELELLCFCHEVGHIIDDRTKSKHRKCRYEREFNAWAHAIRLAQDEFGLKLQQIHAHWIHERLDSYRLYCAKSHFC